MRRGKKRYGLVIALVAFLWACLLIEMFIVLRTADGAAQAISDQISTPVRNFLGKISSCIPFSVMECLYAILIIGFVLFVLLSVVWTIKAKHKGYTLLRQGIILLTVAAYILAGYGWLWGMEYYKAGFAEKSGLQVCGVSEEELLKVTAYFAVRAGALSDQIQRDEAGHAAVSREELLNAYDTVYNRAQTEYPVLQGPVTKPKEMFFSKIMSYMGFTGIYFPFSGESNLNADPPVALFGFTLAHELAHQKGIAAEQEANFCGVYACVTSDQVEYMYSGYLGGLIYLSNALYSANPEAYGAVCSLFTEQMMQDLQDNNDYWKGFETKVTEVSSKAYDIYLRSNGQSSGIRSYGQCVDLLCACFVDEANQMVILQKR